MMDVTATVLNATVCQMVIICVVVGKKLKSVHSPLQETHRRATEHHLPHGITQCYTYHQRQVNAPRHNPSQAGRCRFTYPAAMKG